MNSLPINFRFVSGSVTPLSSARKRSLASTYFKRTWKFSPKTRCTISSSRARSSPLFTKMQVSWSPIALCSSAAVTEELRSILDVQHAGAVLASSGEHDLAAKVMRHQHQSVTNSQDGNAKRKNLWVHLWSAFVVNARGPAGKDDPLRFCCGDFSSRRVEANNFRINLTLTDSPRYDLGVLRAEIEDENF